jgi:hypothetical protein
MWDKCLRQYEENADLKIRLPPIGESPSRFYYGFGASVAKIACDFANLFILAA